MRLIDRYITRRFASTLLACVVVFMAIYVVVDLVEHLDDFMDRGIPPLELAQYYLYFLPHIVVLTLPIAMLLSTLFVVGTMGTDNELAAIKSAGVSVYRLAWPLLRLSLLISVLAMLLAEVVATPATRIRERIVGSKPRASRVSHREITLRDPAGYMIYATRYDPSRQMAMTVMMQQFSGPVTIRRIDAESLVWDGSGWIARKADMRTFGGTSERRTLFDSLYVPLSMLPEDFESRPLKPEEMGFLELYEYIGRRMRAGDDASKWLVDLHLKFSLPLANFVVVLLGFPVAARAWRSGKAADIGWTLLIAFCYLLMLRIGQAMAHAGDVNHLIGGWAGNFLFIAVGISLFGITRK